MCNFKKLPSNLPWCEISTKLWNRHPSFDSSVGRAEDCSGIGQWRSLGRWFKSGWRKFLSNFFLWYICHYPVHKLRIHLHISFVWNNDYFAEMIILLALRCHGIDFNLQILKDTCIAGQQTTSNSLMLKRSSCNTFDDNFGN